MSRKTRLAQVSKKRKDQQGEWDALKTLVRERDGNRCRVASVWPEVVCGGPIDPHHVENTGAGYERLCEPSLLICCCRFHHDALHTETALARRRGVLR